MHATANECMYNLDEQTNDGDGFNYAKSNTVLSVPEFIAFSYDDADGSAAADEGEAEVPAAATGKVLAGVDATAVGGGAVDRIPTTTEAVNSSRTEGPRALSGSVNVGVCGLQAIKPRGMFQRVVGGDECVPHSWPWAASLQWLMVDYPNSPFWHVCGATLISRDFCLTAAHCVLVYFKWSKLL